MSPLDAIEDSVRRLQTLGVNGASICRQAHLIIEGNVVVCFRGKRRTITRIFQPNTLFFEAMQTVRPGYAHSSA